MNRFGKWRAFRLAEKQMYVFRHYDVADYEKLITDSRALQGLLEQAPCGWQGEVWATLIATEGDEVEIPCELISLEALGHGGDCSWVIKNCKRHGRTVDRWIYPTLAAIRPR